MSEQNWGCLDKISEVNFSPAETLREYKTLALLNWDISYFENTVAPDKLASDGAIDPQCFQSHHCIHRCKWNCTTELAGK